MTSEADVGAEPTDETNDQGFPAREDGSFNTADATDELIVKWLNEDSPNVEAVVAAAAGDPDQAKRLLEAEAVTRDGDPRKGVVSKLKAIISPPAPTGGDKRYGLVLTLEGAPATPHFVPGVPGYFRTDSPTPVGGDGELSLEYAQQLDGGSELLELVEIPAGEVAAAVETAQRDLAEGRDAVAETRRSKPKGEEAARVVAEQDALKTPTNSTGA